MSFTLNPHTPTPTGFFGQASFYVGHSKYYNRTQISLQKLAATHVLRHPCLDRTPQACAAMYVAAVTASTVAQAQAAAKCKHVLSPRDCVHVE